MIGVLPEHHGLYNWMTVAEYLSFFGHLYEIKEPELDKHIDSLLSQVGLLPQKYARISTFSFGMRQRLELARALINNAHLLFLDEPTIGLDPQGQKDIQKLLNQLNNNGVTIFLSSHLLDQVANLCSRIGIINKGKLIAIGTIDELQAKVNLKDKTLSEVFLHLINQDLR